MFGRASARPLNKGEFYQLFGRKAVPCPISNLVLNSFNYTEKISMVPVQGACRCPIRVKDIHSIFSVNSLKFSDIIILSFPYL